MAAAGAVIGVVWLIVEPYDIPLETTIRSATFEVAIQPAAWLGLAAALVLLVVALYAALERPTLARGRSWLALVSALVFGALLFAAVSRIAHVQTDWASYRVCDQTRRSPASSPARNGRGLGLRGRLQARQDRSPIRGR